MRMRTQEDNTSEPLWGIGMLQIAWIVFQVLFFLGFAVAWLLGGEGWQPSWLFMLPCLSGSAAAAVLFVWMADRMFGDTREKQRD